MHKSILVFIYPVCLAIIFFTGCGKKSNDEPTKTADQSQLAKMSENAAMKNKPQAGNISDNPAFSSASKQAPASDAVKDLDKEISPVLKRLFGDAKIISESKTPETRVDGEVVENSFTYVVKKVLVPQDGETLHSVLHNDAHFGLSPRLGGKPTILNNGALMSLFKTTSSRPYSLEIKIDTNKQQIIVESYKLGSKYDRL